MFDDIKHPYFFNNFTLKAIHVLHTLKSNKPLITNEQKQKKQPFFIISCGRSGTTLLRSVLYRHPLIDIPPETMSALTNSIKKYIRYNGLFWPDLVNMVIGEFHYQNHFRAYWQTDLRPYLPDLYNLPKEKQSLAHIIDVIFSAHMTQTKTTATIWGAKDPVNIFRLQWLVKLFPTAKYIYLLRDGRDVVSSLKYAKFPNVKTIGEACDRWNRSIKMFEKNKHKIPTNNLLSLKYEDFVGNPAQHTRDLCTFLNIDFLPNMLDTTSKADKQLGDTVLSHHANVKKPISKVSIGKWKNRLTEEEKTYVAKALAKNLKLHNYL